MSNVLSEHRKQQVLSLGRLGWSLRRIEEATGVRRETASKYLKQAGISIRRPGRWGHGASSAELVPKPAKGVSPDFGPKPAKEVSPTQLTMGPGARVLTGALRRHPRGPP